MRFSVNVEAERDTEVGGSKANLSPLSIESRPIVGAVLNFR